MRSIQAGSKIWQGNGTVTAHICQHHIASTLNPSLDIKTTWTFKISPFRRGMGQKCFLHIEIADCMFTWVMCAICGALDFASKAHLCGARHLGGDVVGQHKEPQHQPPAHDLGQQPVRPLIGCVAAVATRHNKTRRTTSYGNAPQSMNLFGHLRFVLVLWERTNRSGKRKFLHFRMQILSCALGWSCDSLTEIAGESE